jgi:hypothetical protein
MKKINSLLMSIYIFSFNLLTIPVFAIDEDPGLPIEGDPGTPAPINDWIFPMMMIGILFVFYYFRKQQKEQKEMMK